MKRLISWIMPKKPAAILGPRKEAVTYRIGEGGWGGDIRYIEFPHRVIGWQRRRPRPGDILLTPMQSGKTLVSVFQQVILESDPPDMFSAVVDSVGYESELVSNAY